ncbi:MAG: recombinase RecT [Lentisphaeria bacterium]|nr:recombinase RecT [Lentisphaeria bacterium]
MPVGMPGVGEMIFDDAKFERMNQLAKMMASGKCAIPRHLQGNPGDCFAIIAQAAQWKMNPFVVAQKTHVVNGALGYEAQLINAVVTSMNVISDRFRYEYVGNWDEYRKSGFAKTAEMGCGVNVGATLRGETEVRWLPMPLGMEQVKTRNSPLWATNPMQQLAYLAVKYWTRLYAPDAILGVYSVDELAEGVAEPVNITPSPAAPKTAKTEVLKDRIGVPAVEPEVVLTMSQKITAAIAETGAGITLEDVTAYMTEKGLLQGYGIDDFNKYPATWRKILATDVKALVDKVVEWKAAAVPPSAAEEGRLV